MLKPGSSPAWHGPNGPNIGSERETNDEEGVPRWAGDGGGGTFVPAQMYLMSPRRGGAGAEKYRRLSTTAWTHAGSAPNSLLFIPNITPACPEGSQNATSKHVVFVVHRYWKCVIESCGGISMCPVPGRDRLALPW